MLDDFDRALLNSAQLNDLRTAESLAEEIPLSPSAIARRLRRLRSDRWIARTIALLSPRLTQRRLRAVVLAQLSDHADHQRNAALLKRIAEAAQVQFCYELAGNHDLVLMFDCADMDEFNAVADQVLISDPAVRRFETSFVKRETKFAPFVQLTAPAKM